MQFNYTPERIPESLKEIDSWVCWTLSDDNDKLPRGVNGIRTDWQKNSGPFEDADLMADAMGFFAGFCFQPELNVIGIDLDSCRNPATGKIEDWAQEVIDQFGTYAEFSVSGTGVKLIGFGRAEERTIHIHDAPQYGDHEPQIDIFCQSFRYFALTGDVLEGFEDATDCGSALTWLDDIHPAPERVTGPKVEKSEGIASEREAEFNASHTIADILSDHDWHVDHIGTKPGYNGDITRMTRPGKAKGVSGEAKRIGDGDVERFFCYTSNGEPFEQWTRSGDPSYSAWQCHVMLNHGGDFPKAYADQYGEPATIKLAPPKKKKAPAQVAEEVEVYDSPAFEPFPLDTLPDLARRFVEEESAAIDCDPSFITLPLLSVIGTCIGNSVWIQTASGFEQPPILWTCIVGKSGSAKSPALSRVESLIVDFESEYQRQYAHDVWEYEKSKTEAKGNKGGLTVAASEPVHNRLITNNATIEKLVVMMAENPKGLIYFSEELAGWISMFTRYSRGSDLDYWLSIYDGRPVNRDRQTTGSVYVRHAFTGVTGGIQPGRIFDVFDPSAEVAGLTARVLFSYPPERIRRFNRNPGGNVEAEAVKERLGQLLELPTGAETDPYLWTPSRIGCDVEAIDAFEDFFNLMNEESFYEYDNIAAAIQKIIGATPRIALILHGFNKPAAISDNVPISGQTMEQAVRIATWALNEARRLYGIVGEKKGGGATLAILEVLRNYPGSTVREMQKRKRKLKSRKSAEVLEACYELETAGKLRKEETAKSERWFLE